MPQVPRFTLCAPAAVSAVPAPAAAPAPSLALAPAGSTTTSFLLHSLDISLRLLRGVTFHFTCHSFLDLLDRLSARYISTLRSPSLDRLLSCEQTLLVANPCQATSPRHACNANTTTSNRIDPTSKPGRQPLNPAVPPLLRRVLGRLQNIH